MTTPTATIFVPWHALEDGIGQWTDVPFSAGDFTSNVGSWSVEAADVLAHAYVVAGKTATVWLHLANATVVTGTPGYLAVAPPAGLAIARPAIGTAAIFSGGVWGLGSVVAVAAGALVLLRPDVSLFPNATDLGGYLTVTFAVV